PEDYMCKGFARSPNDRKEWMSNLDKAIAMRDSPIARTFRAATACMIGLNESDLKLTESGLDDVRLAKFRLRDNSFVRFTSAQGHMNAAILYGKAGQLKQQEEAMGGAKDDVDALEKIPVSGCVHMRVCYYEMVKRDDTALTILEDAVTREETKELVWLYALTLYRKGQVEKALDALDRSRQPENTAIQSLRIFLIAERYGRDKAYEEYQQLIRRARDEGQLWGRGNAWILLFLGKRAEAAEVLRMVAARSDAVGRSQVSQAAAYVARSLPEAEFLKAADDGFSVHYRELMVGLVRLSEGDR